MTEDGTSGSGLTVETALWVLVISAALALRLAQLDTAPLTAIEAREATLAWRAASGQGPPAMDYNPLLLAANALLFTVFGSSDVLARLLPALFGALLALSPLLLRQQMGRVGALAAGLYLAVSPTALVVSRQLSGTAIAASGVMASIGGTVRFLERKDRHWLDLAAVGLALSLVSSATAYALLLPLGLAWLVVSRLWSGRGSSGVGHWLSDVRSHAPQFFLTFTLTLLALCTGFGWNLSGIGAVGGLLVNWFGRFRAAPRPVASPLTLLTVYEPFGLLLGVGSLIWSFQRRRCLGAVLGLWAGSELLLLALMPGRMPTDLLWVVLPLALLAGLTVEALVRNWPRSDLALRTGYAALVFVLWVYGYLMLARYAAFGDRADLALTVIAIVVQALLALSFGLALGPGGALHTVAATTGVVLLALTLSAGWGAAYEHSADPREALLSVPTATDIRDLAQTLRDLSWDQTGMPTTLEFVFEAQEDSVLAWYLRGFDTARRVDQLGDLSRYSTTTVLITDEPDETAVPDLLKAGYAGQDFAVQRHWSPRRIGCRFWEADCHVAFGWYLFRSAPPWPDPTVRATMWRRLDVTGSE
jgi:uncharacterized protein (TIGR03663 family)